MAQPTQAPMPEAPAQGDPQAQGAGSPQVSPDQAMKLMQVAVQSFDQVSGQMDADTARAFQNLESAFMEFAQVVQAPAGQAAPEPRSPGGPIPENAGSRGTPGANY